LYAVFQRNTQADNRFSGRALTLIRPSETRMGGQFYAMMRAARLKRPILDTLTCVECITSKFPTSLKVIIQDDGFWLRIVAICRFTSAMMRLLRTADRATAGMHLLCYFVMKATAHMLKESEELNKLFPKHDTEEYQLFWSKLDDFLGSPEAELKGVSEEDPKVKDVPSAEDSDDESEDDSELDDDSIGEVEESTSSHMLEFNSTVPPHLVGSFAGNLLRRWYDRMPWFLHDYAIAAYICSPVKVIQEHVKANLKWEHRYQVERLLRKLFVETKATAAEQSIEDGRVMNTFWKEYAKFSDRQGPHFDKAWIYEDQDIHDQPHLWHKTNSVPYTTIFGLLACRVCSKIVGIGSAERAWGSVKKLKDNQRSHLGAESVMKQATLYGAYCSKRAQEKKKETGGPITCWEDDDFKSIGLDEYLIDVDFVTGKKKETRTFFAFVQDWEKEAMKVKSNQSEVLLRRKYGGMQYYNVDTDKGTFSPRTIDINKAVWSNKKADKCYKLIGLKEELEDKHPNKVEEWFIEEDLHFMITVFYKKNPDPFIKIVSAAAYAGLVDDGVADEWVRNGGFFNHQLARPTKKLKRTIALEENESTDSDATVGK
jgi:hypothetical protein